MTNSNQFDLDEDIEENYDEEYKELQLAFEKGILQPGLNREVVKQVRIPPINNINGLKSKLANFKLKFDWEETLCLTCEPAPVAPELALQLEAHKRKTIDRSNEKEDDLVYDDFAREMTFYRLGQSAVLKGIPKLQSLRIPTKRPDDYFAEMVKTDDHMHKVRKKLKYKENKILMSEKAKKLRELKKSGKKIQIQKYLERQEEKREILEQLKKYRRGKSNSLDFLEDEPNQMDSNGIMKPKKQLQKELSRLNSIRKHKDEKFGLRGKKKGWKRNTAKDLDGPLDSAGRKVGRAPRGKPQKRKPAKRPGKGTRDKEKQRSNVNRGKGKNK